jgi:hypothetical protein
MLLSCHSQITCEYLYIPDGKTCRDAIYRLFKNQNYRDKSLPEQYWGGKGVSVIINLLNSKPCLVLINYVQTGDIFESYKDSFFKTSPIQRELLTGNSKRGKTPV